MDKLVNLEKLLKPNGEELALRTGGNFPALRGDTWVVVKSTLDRTAVWYYDEKSKWERWANALREFQVDPSEVVLLDSPPSRRSRMSDTPPPIAPDGEQPSGATFSPLVGDDS